MSIASASSRADCALPGRKWKRDDRAYDESAIGLLMIPALDCRFVHIQEWTRNPARLPGFAVVITHISKAF